MKKYLPLLLILLSCSKPAGQDATASADTTTVVISQDNQQPITLTPDEEDRVATEIFLELRRQIAFSRVVYSEGFKVNGNEFEYKVNVVNSDPGVRTDTFEGTGPPTEDEQKEWEADSTHEGPAPWTPYTRTTETYTPPVDSILIQGTYIAYLASPPESASKEVQVSITGTATRLNARDVVDGEIKESHPENRDLGDMMEGFVAVDMIIIDLNTPLTFSTDNLYVKAKIKDLTNEDLAGLSKDELSFVRNDIFAHHGHTFKTPKMASHYSGMEWYKATVGDAVIYLNEFEKRNVDFIKKREG
jgi:hypothetical protein